MKALLIHTATPVLLICEARDRDAAMLLGQALIVGDAEPEIVIVAPGSLIAFDIAVASLGRPGVIIPCVAPMIEKKLRLRVAEALVDGHRYAEFEWSADAPRRALPTVRRLLAEVAATPESAPVSPEARDSAPVARTPAPGGSAAVGMQIVPSAPPPASSSHAEQDVPNDGAPSVATAVEETFESSDDPPPAPPAANDMPAVEGAALGAASVGQEMTPLGGSSPARATEDRARARDVAEIAPAGRSDALPRTGARGAAIFGAGLAAGVALSVLVWASSGARAPDAATTTAPDATTAAVAAFQPEKAEAVIAPPRPPTPVAPSPSESAPSAPASPTAMPPAALPAAPSPIADESSEPGQTEDNVPAAIRHEPSPSEPEPIKAPASPVETKAMVPPSPGPSDDSEAGVAAARAAGVIQDDVGAFYLYAPVDRKFPSTWGRAMVVCKRLEVGGVTGWHLPTRSEFKQVVSTRLHSREQVWTASKAGTDGTEAYVYNRKRGFFRRVPKAERREFFCVLHKDPSKRSSKQ